MGKELAGKAKENKLQPHEFQGGSFTISNLGMFGVSHFTAVINPPQAAILAVGGARAKTVGTTNADGTVELSTVNEMTACLSYDERVIDRSDMAMWMAAFKKHLENPQFLV